MKIRCPWAIKFGVTLHTRCQQAACHEGNHAGNGLSDFPYQGIVWLPGDRREYTTNRDDEYAWED